jgi:high-affinity nickel-transport protein
VNPLRKLYYNMTITAVSVLVALIVGGIEAFGLLVDKLGLHGRAWDLVRTLNQHFGIIGYLIIGIFIASWIVSAVVYQLKGYDRIEIA